MPCSCSQSLVLFALSLGSRCSNGLLLKFVTPVSRLNPSYAVNDEASPSMYRGLITFDLDNTLFPMQPVLLDAGAAVEAYAGSVLEPEAVATAMKALRAASGRAASSAAVAASANANSFGGVDEASIASSFTPSATPSAAPWSYTRTRIAAYEALLADDEASSGNSGAVTGSDAWADSWLECDGHAASCNNEDGEDMGSTRCLASQGFSRAAKIDAEISSDALASFDVWLNERQAAAGRHLWADVAPCLAALEREGWLLGAITNGRGDPTAIPGLELLQFCASGEDVAIYPLRKPHRAIFEAAVARANSMGWHGTMVDSSGSSGGSTSGSSSRGQPTEALWWHIGDCLHDDVSGASTCGARTVLITRRDCATGEYLFLPNSRKANPLATPAERGDNDAASSPSISAASADALKKKSIQPDLVVESLDNLHAQLVFWEEQQAREGEATRTEAEGTVGASREGGDESLHELLSVPTKELRVSRLRSALKHRQLPSTGNKATLVARLQAAAAAGAATDAQGADSTSIDSDSLPDTDYPASDGAPTAVLEEHTEKPDEARQSLRSSNEKERQPVLKDGDVADAIAGGGLYSTPRDGTAATVELKAGDWVCKQCNFHNFASRAVCFSCKKPQGTAGLSLPEGVKLKDALSTLVDEMGWAELAEQTGIRCFVPNKFGPTMASALRFLRSPSETWARARVESLYLELGLFIADDVE